MKLDINVYRESILERDTERFIHETTVHGQTFRTSQEVTRSMLETSRYDAMNYINHAAKRILELEVEKVMLSTFPTVCCNTTASAGTTCTLSVGTTSSTYTTLSAFDRDTSVSANATYATSPITFNPTSYRTATELIASQRYASLQMPFLVYHESNSLHFEYIDPCIKPVETEEERFVREWNEILEQKQYRNRMLTQEKAKSRALKLLTRNLTKIQLERFEKDQCIPVDGQSGKKYVIQPAKAINIKVVGKHHKLCAGPKNEMPIYDFMLAQKLQLEHNEKEFLKIAIVHK